jgi:hypothetical protein
MLLNSILVFRVDFRVFPFLWMVNRLVMHFYFLDLTLRLFLFNNDKLWFVAFNELSYGWAIFWCLWSFRLYNTIDFSRTYKAIAMCMSALALRAVLHVYWLCCNRSHSDKRVVDWIATTIFVPLETLQSPRVNFVGFFIDHVQGSWLLTISQKPGLWPRTRGCCLFLAITVMSLNSCNLLLLKRVVFLTRSYLWIAKIYRWLNHSFLINQTYLWMQIIV